MFNYLSVHTKVRRLGYLKLLLNQYFERDFIAVNNFNQFFERVASDKGVLKQLEGYKKYYRKDNKGVIEYLGNGVSAEPYTKLAEDLSLIAKSNYSYVLTKYGKVYRVIAERYLKERNKFRFVEEQKLLQTSFPFDNSDNNSNVFVLNTLDQYFFLKTLIEKDFLYLKCILLLIKSNDKQNPASKIKYLFLKEKLSSQLVAELKSLQTFGVISLNDKIRISNLEKRLSSRSLQIRSYESIVEPRVNWLLDLNLLDGPSFNKDILKLTVSGEKFIERIKLLYDVASFIENDYVKTFCTIYGFSERRELQLDKKIEKYLNYAFINFKTLAPNRITASQAFNYISIMCFLRDGVILEYKEIKNYLFARDGKGIMIDWFPSENDGSIKKTDA